MGIRDIAPLLLGEVASRSRLERRRFSLAPTYAAPRSCMPKVNRTFFAVDGKRCILTFNMKDAFCIQLPMLSSLTLSNWLIGSFEFSLWMFE